MAARLPCDFLLRGMCLVGHVNLSAGTCIQMCPMIPCVPNKPHNSVRSVDPIADGVLILFPLFLIFFSLYVWLIATEMILHYYLLRLFLILYKVE